MITWTVKVSSGFLIFPEGEEMWDGYRTPRWTRLREKILRRDEYLSREARRYGRNVEADTVHHVWPAEDFPQWAWSMWNLISITHEEHRLMHNADGSLTELGDAWRRRLPPPRPLESDFSPFG